MRNSGRQAGVGSAFVMFELGCRTASEIDLNAKLCKAASQGDEWLLPGRTVSLVQSENRADVEHIVEVYDPPDRGTVHPDRLRQAKSTWFNRSPYIVPGSTSWTVDVPASPAARSRPSDGTTCEFGTTAVATIGVPGML